MKQMLNITKVVIIVLALALVSMLPAFSCGSSWPHGKVGVAVTIAPLADFVEQVGGNKVEVVMMVPPGRSPHDYEPTPSQMTQLSRADMYAKVGSGVEFELTWMDNLIEQNDDMHIVDCSVGIELLEGEEHEDEHEEEPENEHEEEENGHHHEGEDPHIWLSPINAKAMVQHICAGLVEVDPGNSDYYEQNRDDYLEELDDLNDYIEDAFDGYTNRNFIIYHPAFAYFAHDYELTQIPIEHGGKEPTAQVMEEAIEHAEEDNLDYIFVDPQGNQEYAQTIAGQIGGSLAEIDPLPSDYISSMEATADAIALELE